MPRRTQKETNTNIEALHASMRPGRNAPENLSEVRELRVADLLQ